ncbi:MAG: DUF4111 domain-containing protein [Nocardioides sp.]
MLVDDTDPSADQDDVLRKLLEEGARTQERGPVHRMVLNGCRVLRHLADRAVVTRAEAGAWALTSWRESDHALIGAALARETGADKKAAIDMGDAYFFGFRVDRIARGDADPQDQ